MLTHPKGPAAPAAAAGRGRRAQLSRRLHDHRRGTALTLAACAAALPLLTACGSASTPAQALPSKTCQQVSAVLSDGPDPSADPVGYAEAQILQLRSVHTTDPTLRTAISKLADAYAWFFDSDGKSPAAISAVTAAAKQMNKLCPGAGATA